MEYKITNTSDKSARTSIVSTIQDTKESEMTKTLTIPALAEVKVKLDGKMPKDRVRLWDFNHPNLYSLNTSLRSDEGALSGIFTD